jgi:uncharacterized membrane protein (DUF485 family)
MSVTQPSTQPSGRGRVSAYEVVHVSREFRTLRRHFGSFVVPAAVMFLGWYFLYVILADFAPGFMKTSVFGAVNIGLCLGVLQFVSTFLITVSYLRWGRRHLDSQSDRLRQRLEAGRGR